MYVPEMFVSLPKLLGIVLLALAIQGCVSVQTRLHGLYLADRVDMLPVTALAEVPVRTRVAYNPHQGVLEINAPAIFDHQRMPPSVYALDSAIDPKRPGQGDRFQLRIIALFPKRVFLKQVYAEGKALKTRTHDRERIGCSDDCAVRETVIVTVSEEQLIAWTALGLQLEVEGRRTDFRMFIPATYIKSMLDRHRSERQRLVHAPP
jgi:hypothetical protein